MVLVVVSSEDSALQRVLIVGAGAIGTLIAGKLAARSSLEVLLASRRPLPEVSLTVSGQRAVVPVTVVTDPEQVEVAVDWVVVATKAYDTEALRPWIAPFASAGAFVGVSQNGIEQVDRVATMVSRDRAIPLIVTYGAQRPAPGEVVETVAGAIRVPAGAVGARLVALADCTDLEVEIVDDFVTALWTKLAWNLVGNSLTTLTDLPMREIGLRPQLRDLGLAMVEECRRVAEAEGAALDPGLAEATLGAFARLGEGVNSSMWQDRAAGRPLEYDAISGAVVRAAARHGMDAPYSKMATTLLETMSRRLG